MCRLYTFRSNSLRKVECELINSQNSLLAQSCRDERGLSNPHGWGLATYDGPVPSVVRQQEAAYDSDAFRLESAKVYSCNVLAHVRRATVGGLGLENTHPFVHGKWLLAHNGNLAAFKCLRPRLLSTMQARHRTAIQGATDSEHMFHFLLSLRARHPERPLLEILRRGVRDVIDWSHNEDASAEVAANIIVSNGEETVGLRYGRSLWYVERDLMHPCEVCDGALHIKAGATGAYRAVVVASEPITKTEEWTTIPDATLFRVDPRMAIHLEPL